MRKFIYFFIPIVILALFIFVMVSDSIIKRNIMGTNKDVVNFIEITINNIENNQWEKAVKSTKELETAWKKVSKLLQFSVEKDQMDKLEASMARLKGAIRAKDRSNALIELFETKSHWNGLGR